MRKMYNYLASMLMLVAMFAMSNVAMAQGWKFASVTPAEGVVESLHNIKFGYPDSFQWIDNSATLSISCPNGATASIMIADNFDPTGADGVVLDQTLTAPGTYTLTIPAGTIQGGGTGNAEMKYTWTIAGGDNPGGDNPGGTTTGNPWQEVIFKSGETQVSTPVVFNTNGINITTVGREFMGTTIDVSYNMYEENEIDWKTGTKLVITPNGGQTITGIVIEGQFVEFASADKGTYLNGVWSGSLAPGNTLTLTANDGINIHNIVVLYNGDEYVMEEEETQKVDITFNITKTNWATMGSLNGEVIGNVSSNADPFDHYDFMIVNNDDPDQIITVADLTNVEGNIVVYSWEGGVHDLYNGQHYTLTIQCFDSPQYGSNPIAVATYDFVGKGKAPIVYNEDITVNITGLAPNTTGIADYNATRNEFTVEFSEPVSKVQAIVAKGFDGSTKLTATSDATGKKWTVSLSPLTDTEGAANIQIIAWDANNNPLRAAYEAKPYAFNLLMDISGEPEEEVTEKCATPTIAVADGKLKFTCATEGATFSCDIKASGAQTGVIMVNGDEVEFTPVYTITVVASAPGYKDSDKATATVSLDGVTAPVGIKGDVDGNGIVNVKDAVDVIDIYLKK